MTWVCDSCEAEKRKRGRHRRHLTCQRKVFLGFKEHECQCPCQLDRERGAWS